MSALRRSGPLGRPAARVPRLVMRPSAQPTSERRRCAASQCRPPARTPRRHDPGRLFLPPRRQRSVPALLSASAGGSTWPAPVSCGVGARFFRSAGGAKSGVRALAAARLGILDAQGRARRDASSLGPYLGTVGAPSSDVDPRNGRLYVTSLEGVTRCPWQAFLRRVLRVEPVPEPLGPMTATRSPASIVSRGIRRAKSPPA